MTEPLTALFSPLVERAMRAAAQWHRTDVRKGSDIPYITHPASLALILVQAGFNEENTLAAALLHDVVEDTECTLDELASTFPPTVVEYVAALSEGKLDERGEKRSWQVRKDEHIAGVVSAPIQVRAIVLADKLHNLATMCHDAQIGPDFWDRFNSTPERILWYNRTMVEQAAGSDQSLQPLARECEACIARLRQAIDSSDSP